MPIRRNTITLPATLTSCTEFSPSGVDASKDSIASFDVCVCSQFCLNGSYPNARIASSFPFLTAYKSWELSPVVLISWLILKKYLIPQCFTPSPDSQHFYDAIPCRGDSVAGRRRARKPLPVIHHAGRPIPGPLPAKRSAPTSVCEPERRLRRVPCPLRSRGRGRGLLSPPRSGRRGRFSAGSCRPSRPRLFCRCIPLCC